MSQGTAGHSSTKKAPGKYENFTRSTKKGFLKVPQSSQDVFMCFPRKFSQEVFGVVPGSYESLYPLPATSSATVHTRPRDPASRLLRPRKYLSHSSLRGLHLYVLRRTQASLAFPPVSCLKPRLIQYKIGFYTIWSRFITSTNLNPRLRLSMFKSSSNSSASYLNRSIGGDPRI